VIAGFRATLRVSPDLEVLHLFRNPHDDPAGFLGFFHFNDNPAHAGVVS
jgi:hypothetical protein